MCLSTHAFAVAIHVIIAWLRLEQGLLCKRSAHSVLLVVRIAVGSCRPGEERLFAADGSPFCTVCTAGHYSIDGITCLPCPTGATCPGGALVFGEYLLH